MAKITVPTIQKARYRLRRRLFRAFREIKTEANYIFQISQSLTPPILTLMMLAYIVSAYVETYLGNFTFNSLPVRLVVVGFLIPFLFRPYWSYTLNQYGALYSSATTGILFPFCFGAIVFIDSAMSNNSEEINSFAVLEYVLSTFFMVQVLVHMKLILIVWSISTLTAASLILFVDSPNLAAVWNHCVYISPFFFTILLVGGIINKNLYNFQKEKELAVWNVANSIAHQIRTPLATIRNLARGSKNHLPRLVETYQRSVAAGSVEEPIPQQKLEILNSSLESILDEVKHSSALIDILIANSKPFKELEAPQNSLDIGEIVTKAVEDYPYNNPYERSLIAVDTEHNFQVNALENMILHVLYNLIANAVEFSQKRKSGKIKIWFEQNEQWNKVCVWDSGIGIPKRHLHEVFDPFFSRNSPNGTGIGLSFCKSVMEGIGGKIQCDSIEDEYCQFTLLFPKPSDHPKMRSAFFDNTSANGG